VRKAFAKGSEDNLTASVIEFPWQSPALYRTYEEEQKAKSAAHHASAADPHDDIFT
jgi:hypothetical protein